MKQKQQYSPAEILSQLWAIGIVVSVDGEKLKLKPTPAAELVELVRRHKAEILAELAAPTKSKWPALVSWKMRTAGVYRDEKFSRMASEGPAGAEERQSAIVLTTMPIRDEEFRVPYGAIAWSTGAEWREMKDLPKDWRL